MLENVNIESSNKPEENPTDSYNTPLWIPILALIINFLTIRNIILNRSSEDVISNTLYLAISFLTLFLIFLFYNWVKREFKKIGKIEIFILIFSPILSLIFAIVYYSLGASIKDLFIYFQSGEKTQIEIIFIAVFLTFAIGIFLFYFRLKLRAIYGIVEVLTGLAVAANRFSTERNILDEDSGFYLAILTASIYLVVRGLDNIHQGLTKEPFDPIMSKFINRFKKNANT